jgi:hypothetical protein
MGSVDVELTLKLPEDVAERLKRAALAAGVEPGEFVARRLKLDDDLGMVATDTGYEPAWRA